MKALRLVILIVGCVLLAIGVRLLYLRSHSTSSDETVPISVKITRSTSERSGQKSNAILQEKPVPAAESLLTDKESESPVLAAPTPFKLSITTAKLPMGVVGLDYHQILKAAGLEGNPNWKIDSGDLPPGLEVEEEGVVVGIPKESGEWLFTILVVDEKGNIDRKEFRLLIRQATAEEEAAILSIVTNSIPEGFLGRAYLQNIECKGGEPPYRWTLSSGVLPELIQVNQQSGVLYGTPREVGKFSFTLRLTDSAEMFVEKNFILEIKEGTIEIVTAALPPASKGEKYSLTFRAQGGVVPYRWDMVTGHPPEGLRFDPERGVLSGIPEKWETSTFLLRVTGREGRSAEKEFKLEVSASIQRITDLRIVTASLPTAVRGELYNAELTATDGALPYTWTVSQGELPPSLSLNSETGQISGIPEEAGRFTFTVLVSDNTGNTAQSELNLTVDYQLVYITTGTLEVAVVGSGYQQSITVTGGTPPYTFQLESGELPENLSLDSVSGQILGTISENYLGQGTQEFTFRVKATDQAGHYDIVELNMIVRETAEPTPLFSPTPRPSTSPTPTLSPVGLHISTASLPEGVVGENYNQSVAALGGVEPYAWNIQNLPPGLSGSDSGIISGIPESVGEYSVRVSVTDAAVESVSKTFDLTIIEINVEGVSGLIGAPGDGKIGLAWTNPKDFSGVKVLRKTGDYPRDTEDGTVAYEGSGDNFVDDGLDGGTSYFYGVIAYNDKGYAGDITELKVTIPGESDPYADKVVGYYPLSSQGFGETWVLGLKFTGDPDDDIKYNIKALQKGSDDSPPGTYIWLEGGGEGEIVSGSCEGGGGASQYCLQGFGPADGTFSQYSELNNKPVYYNSTSNYFLFWYSYFDEETFISSRALGAPEGGGSYMGSYDVVSLQAKENDGNPPCGGTIVVRFTDNIVVDGSGDDFTVFENVFYLDGNEKTRFMEPAIVYVSQDGIQYYRFPCNYVLHTFSNGDINYFNPYSYSSGFAGVNPVFSNSGSPDPTNPSVSGGDSFDLEDIGGLTWIQYIKIKSTGDDWLTDDDGHDKIRHIKDLGACSGTGSSGFDLDAVSAVNY
jgi:Putative Ig domain